MMDNQDVTGASPVATGLAGAEAPEPHAGLGPSDGNPSADTYPEFERGERHALLEVRSFITKRGTKEVFEFCGQRLHDMQMDLRGR